MFKLEMKDAFSFLCINRKIFFTMQFFAFLFYFPIIFGSIYYADDVSRIHTGYFGWDGLGRYFATYIAELYSLNKSTIIDPMPTLYIINIFIIGLSSYLIYLKFKKEYDLSSILIPALFVINPFLIENLLYRYDSLGMILSLFFVVFAFSLKLNNVSFFLKVLSLMISMNFYQTFSNLYIGLIGIEILLLINSSNSLKKVFFAISVNASIFMLANVLYLIELKLLNNNSSRSELLQLSPSVIWKIFINLKDGFNLFFDFWANYKYFILILIPFIILSILRLCISLKLKILITILFSLFLVFFSGIGFMSLLKNQFLSPRGLSYFPITLMFLCVLIWLGLKSIQYIILIPVFACFIFSSRVGNMAKVQTNFEKPILYSLSENIYKLDESNKNIKNYYVRGCIPLSNYLINITKNTPFNGFLHRCGWGSTGKIYEYYKGKIRFEWSGQEYNNKFTFNESDTKLIVDSLFYKIYLQNDTGWIIWK